MGAIVSFLEGMSGGKRAADATSAKYTEQERLAVLEQIARLESALSQAQGNNDKAALAYYEQEVKAAQANKKAINDLMRDALKADGTMNVEILKQRGADLRNIRDNIARTVATYGRRGVAEYQRAVGLYSRELADPTNMGQAQTAVINYMMATLDPSDPATYDAFQAARAGLGANYIDGTAAEVKMNDAKKAWDEAQNAIKNAERFSANPPKNAEEAAQFQAALKTMQETGTPNFQAARDAIGPGATTDIKNRIQELEGRLSSTAASGGIQPPTMEQLSAAAQRSGYRKWAEARGFQLGTVGDNGQYIPGPDDQKAYWRAWREANGMLTFGRNKMGNEASLVVMPTNGEEGVQSRKWKTVLFGTTEGGLIENPAGDLFFVAPDGSKRLIRDRDGNWKNPQDKIDYEQATDELSPATLAGVPITGDNVKDALTVDGMENYFADDVDAKPASTTRVNGRILNPLLSDDPNNTIRMAVPGDNGVVYEVKYTRENADMPWVEQERKESKRYAGTLKPAMPDGSPIPEPVKLREQNERKRKNNPRDLPEPFNGRTEVVGEDLHSDPNAADGSGTDPNETFPNGEGVGGKRTKVPETARERDNRRRHTGVGPDGKDMKMNMEGPSAPPVFDPNQPIDPGADIREGLESMPEDTMLTRSVEPITRQRVVPPMNPLPTGYNPDEPRRPLSRPINGVNPEIPAAGQGDVLSQTGDTTVDMERGPLVTGYDRKLDQTRAELGIMEVDQKMAADDKAKKAREDAAAATEAARVAEEQKKPGIFQSLLRMIRREPEKQMKKPRDVAK